MFLLGSVIPLWQFLTFMINKLLKHNVNESRQTFAAWVRLKDRWGLNSQESTRMLHIYTAFYWDFMILTSQIHYADDLGKKFEDVDFFFLC